MAAASTSSTAACGSTSWCRSVPTVLANATGKLTRCCRALVVDPRQHFRIAEAHKHSLPICAHLYHALPQMSHKAAHAYLCYARQGLYQIFVLFLVVYGAPAHLSKYALPSACMAFSNVDAAHLDVSLVNQGAVTGTLYNPRAPSPPGAHFEPNRARCTRGPCLDMCCNRNVTSTECLDNLASQGGHYLAGRLRCVQGSPSVTCEADLVAAEPVCRCGPAIVLACSMLVCVT